MADSQQSAHVLGRRSFRLAVVVGGTTIAAATAAGVVLAAQFAARPAHRTAVVSVAVVKRVTPTAAQVARDFVGVNNAYARAHGSAARIGDASCLEGDPGAYVCSFVRSAPPKPDVCAVAMLEWTPHAASTYTVEQAGRVPLDTSQCGPVKQVLHALGTSG